MKQNPAILKDLQEHGRGGATAGHGMTQSGQRQEVANINHVAERPETYILKTDPANSPYKISTEPQPNINQSNFDARDSSTANTPPDLAEVIAAWPILPYTIRLGISAMVKAFIGNHGHVK